MLNRIWVNSATTGLDILAGPPDHAALAVVLMLVSDPAATTSGFRVIETPRIAGLTARGRRQLLWPVWNLEERLSDHKGEY